MNAPKLELVHLAIRSGIFGHIQWKDAAELLVIDDAELQVAGLMPIRIRRLLRDFVINGNLLDVREEARAEYLEANPDDPYWYRAVIPVRGLPHGLFIEVKLIDDDQTEP